MVGAAIALVVSLLTMGTILALWLVDEWRQRRRSRTDGWWAIRITMDREHRTHTRALYAIHSRYLTLWQRAKVEAYLERTSVRGSTGGWAESRTPAPEWADGDERGGRCDGENTPYPK